MKPPEIIKMTLKGNLSGKLVVIDIEVVVALINAYMVVIPNEKRTLSQSLKVLRLHEELNEVLKAEEAAGLQIIEKKTITEEDQ